MIGTKHRCRPLEMSNLVVPSPVELVDDTCQSINFPAQVSMLATFLTQQRAKKLPEFTIGTLEMSSHNL